MDTITTLIDKDGNQNFATFKGDPMFSIGQVVSLETKNLNKEVWDVKDSNIKVKVIRKEQSLRTTYPPSGFVGAVTTRNDVFYYVEEVIK